MWCADCVTLSMVLYFLLTCFLHTQFFLFTRQIEVKTWCAVLDYYCFLIFSRLSPGAVALNSSKIYFVSLFCIFCISYDIMRFFFLNNNILFIVYIYWVLLSIFVNVWDSSSFKLRAIFRLVFAVPAANIHIKWTIHLARTIEYFRLGVIRHR